MSLGSQATRLLLGDSPAYELTSSGWRSLQVMSLQETLGLVKPEHRSRLEKTLGRLHSSREIALVQATLLQPAAATSGTSVVIRRVDGGFMDAATLNDETMQHVAQVLGLVPEMHVNKSDDAPGSDETIEDDSDDVVKAKKRGRKRR
jgi:hypothetical protein